MSNKMAWGGFWLLALIWGSSFLLIRIGVEQLPAFQLVFMRTLIAAVGLNIVISLRGQHLPTDWVGVRDLLFLGVVNTVLPFALITWGETKIESGLASVLQGTVALFTLAIAHFAFADERFSARKAAGLVVGFLGVVVLAGRSAPGGGVAEDPAGHLLGQLAIIGASCCYAAGNIYGRRAMQRRLDPLVVAAGTMTVAAVLSGAAAWLSPALGGPAPAELTLLTPGVAGAVLALGLVNTFGAYLIYYPLVARLGATNTAMVTYVIPVFGLLLGAIFLREPVDALLIAGALLILGGIAIVNLGVRSLAARLGLRRQARPAEEC